jgi:hypothetical protein
MSSSKPSRVQNLVHRFAGTFVLGSLALGWWVHPAWFLFTAFVGANLLQWSFTGICPLDALLRRMLKEEKPAALRDGRAEA